MENQRLLRVRFKADIHDYRPVLWPPKHPYWCTGEDDNNSILVSYADSVTYILKMWPEALLLDVQEVDRYEFTDRFAKPLWFHDDIENRQFSKMTVVLEPGDIDAAIELMHSIKQLTGIKSVTAHPIFQRVPESSLIGINKNNKKPE